jgi:hypothetical protein
MDMVKYFHKIQNPSKSRGKREEDVEVKSCSVFFGLGLRGDSPNGILISILRWQLDDRPC